VVAFADDDVIVHPLWTYRVWETFLYPDAAAMTGLIVASSLETESQQIFEKYWGFNRGYCDKVFDYSFIESNLKIGPPVWSIGAGANMAFRKSVFDAVGYFDERLGAGASGCSEDSELWFRILMNGFNIHYNPRAVIYHEHRKDMRALRTQLYSYARGHVAAALIQQKLNKKAGYKQRVFFEFPMFFFRRLVKGFPLYRQKGKTILSEMMGWYSGVLYYKRKCTKAGNSSSKIPMIMAGVVKKAKLI
jgi:cellulose synthase/poly-beta-1,6-N-acetylglucosamine synthase-like glycosyltransferase